MRLLTRGLFNTARVGGGTIITPPPPPPIDPDPPGGGGTGGGPVVELGTAIAPYIHQPGGQIITVKAGRTYTAGVIDFTKIAHPNNTNRLNDNWLVIVAQEPDVEIDLADGFLNVAYDAVNNWIPNSTPPWYGRYQRLPFRVLFVGFKIKWGRAVFSWLDQIRFWHCKFTFPIEQWNTRYRAAYRALHGGNNPAYMSTVDVNAFALMGNNITATPLGFDQTTRIEFWHCDFYDCGEDGVYLTSSSVFFYGCRWWKMTTKGYDYGSPNFPGATHMHPDGVQIPGACTLVCRKFAMGAHWESDAEIGGGAPNNVTVADGWTFDTPAHSGSGTGHTGSWRRVKWFGHGTTYGQNDPGAPRGYSSESDAFNYTFPGGYDGSPNLQWFLDNGAQTTGYNFAQANHLTPGNLPAGITLDYAGGKLLSDAMLTAVLDHPQNPAILARAEPNCGIGQWQAFFDALETASPGSGWPA